MRSPLLVLTRLSQGDQPTLPQARSELALVLDALGQRAAGMSAAQARAAAVGWSAADVVCIDPVSVVATLDNLVLAAVVTDLDAAESEALAAMLEDLAGTCFRKVAMSPTGQAVAECPGVKAFASIDPQLAVGQSLRELPELRALPGTLRSLEGECQMALHSLAFNAARLERGRAAVTSLWFWGAGRAESLPQLALPPLAANDATLAGCWRASGNDSGIAAHWSEVLERGGGGVIVPRDIADGDALAAALAARSPLRRWRQPARLLARDGSPLADWPVSGFVA